MQSARFVGGIPSDTGKDDDEDDVRRRRRRGRSRGRGLFTRGKVHVAPSMQIARLPCASRPVTRYTRVSIQLVAGFGSRSQHDSAAESRTGSLVTSVGKREEGTRSEEECRAPRGSLARGRFTRQICVANICKTSRARCSCPIPNGLDGPSLLVGGFSFFATPICLSVGAPIPLKARFLLFVFFFCFSISTIRCSAL